MLQQSRLVFEAGTINAPIQLNALGASSMLNLKLNVYRFPMQMPKKMAAATRRHRPSSRRARVYKKVVRSKLERMKSRPIRLDQPYAIRDKLPPELLQILRIKVVVT